MRLNDDRFSFRTPCLKNTFGLKRFTNKNDYVYIIVMDKEGKNKKKPEVDYALIQINVSKSGSNEISDITKLEEERDREMERGREGGMSTT